MAFSLEQVVPWGRTYEEYRRMFALTEADMSKRILGLADGPASFNAEATRLGYDVVSCDPLYEFSVAQVEQRIKETYNLVVEQTRANAHQFTWKDFADADAVGKARMKAMRAFLKDFPTGKREGRYLPVSLPGLPFEDGDFDLALCSHFLFLYSEQFGQRMHIESVQELARVAKEVRIFPLHNLANELSEYVYPVIRTMVRDGYHVETVPVPYEFQKGARRMLVIKRIG